MKYIKIAASMLGILIGLFAINEYVVSEAELDAFEVKTVQTLEQFQKEMYQQNDMQRLDRLNDEYFKYRLYLKEHPNDECIKNDFRELIRQRDALREKLGL